MLNWGTVLRHVSEAAALSGIRAIAIAAPALTMLVIGQIYGADDLGHYATFQSTFLLFSNISTVGVASTWALFRNRLEHQPLHLSHLDGSMILMCTIGCIITTIFASFYFLFTSNSQYSLVIAFAIGPLFTIQATGYAFCVNTYRANVANFIHFVCWGVVPIAWCLGDLLVFGASRLSVGPLFLTCTAFATCGYLFVTRDTISYERVSSTPDRVWAYQVVASSLTHFFSFGLLHVTLLTFAAIGTSAQVGLLSAVVRTLGLFEVARSGVVQYLGSKIVRAFGLHARTEAWRLAWMALLVDTLTAATFVTYLALWAHPVSLLFGPQFLIVDSLMRWPGALYAGAFVFSSGYVFSQFTKARWSAIVVSAVALFVPFAIYVPSPAEPLAVMVLLFASAASLRSAIVWGLGILHLYSNRNEE